MSSQRDLAQPGRSCAVLDVAEAGATVTVRWKYRKPAATTTVAQRFRCRDAWIAGIRLKFDEGAARGAPAAAVSQPPTRPCGAWPPPCAGNTSG